METPRLGLAGAQLSVTSFVSSSHPTESCGINGLPLTPHSISILGAAQLLLTCEHGNLARYLDVQRGKHQRIILVVETWQNNLSNLSMADMTELSLLNISRQVLLATAYLNEMNIVNTNISRRNIMLTEDGDVKLFNFGLGRMTNYGEWVDFPCGDPRLTAPEILRQERRVESLSSLTDVQFSELSITTIAPEPVVSLASNVDTWSLGMVLASLALDIPELWPGVKVVQVIRKVASLAECESGAVVLERIAREHGCVGRVSTLPQAVLDLIQLCLSPAPAQRPSPAQLLTSEIFTAGQPAQPELWRRQPASFPTSSVRSSGLVWPPPRPAEDRREMFSVRELYYLWQLAGGEAQAELSKHGLMVTTPPILSLPSVCTGEGQAIGQPKQRGALYDPTIINLPTTQLQSCLDNINIDTLMPLLETKEEHFRDIERLPLVIRERDVKYQCSRVVLYRKLLQGYPYRKKRIWSESLIDVVPKYRATIWAALLGVPNNCYKLYAAIDKESPSPVDRQIEVDIPRCHQYNELLASPEGHRKLKRILKAWVSDNSHLVYWQGLDSLAAPFLFLNFNDETLAWACLSAFIPKYLHNMFLQDNATVIQEYLAKFSQLQAFHEPELFNHLDEIGFIPDLYAIPWVLTMFSHVFPLHKIFHLWDRLLLGNSSYPLCIGLAILNQLKDQLMEAQFNECILLFSDMPAVDIDAVVSSSMEIFKSTPSSLSWRQSECERGPPGPLDMTPIEIRVLKTEKVGRISGAELLKLTEGSSQKAICLDIRPAEEFKLGTLPGAFNVPADSAFTENGMLASHADTVEAARRRGKIIAVVGSCKDKAAVEFAERLLQLQCARLVTLHAGVEVFRSAGVLVVPHA